MILKKDFKQNVLITGSTSGLGYYLSELFIDDNYNVFVNGSSKPKLDLFIFSYSSTVNKL